MKGIQGHWGNDGNDIPVRLGYRWGPTLADKRTPHWYAGTGPWAKPVFSKDHDGISLAEEEAAPNSLLKFYRRLIQVRLALPALRVGSQEEIPLENPHVIEIMRRSGPKGSESVFIFANLSGDQQTVPAGRTEDAPNLWTSGSYFGGARTFAPYEFQIVVPPSKYHESNTRPMKRRGGRR